MSMRASNLITTGSWTPILKFGGVDVTDVSVGGGVAVTGKYGKIGPFVLISGAINLSPKGTPSGLMTIEGVPFDSDATYMLTWGMFNGWHALPATAYWEAAILTSTIYAYRFVAGSPTQLDDTDVVNASEIIFTGLYMTAA